MSFKDYYKEEKKKEGTDKKVPSKKKQTYASAIEKGNVLNPNTDNSMMNIIDCVKNTKMLNTI